MHIPEGPISRSKARTLQEGVQSLTMTAFPMQEAMQEATKIMHVITSTRWPCIVKLGIKVANTSLHLPPIIQALPPTLNGCLKIAMAELSLATQLTSLLTSCRPTYIIAYIIDRPTFKTWLIFPTWRCTDFHLCRPSKPLNIGRPSSIVFHLFLA